MDTSNGRPNDGVSGAIGDVTMASSDWRTPLQRERIVNKITDILKEKIPFSSSERLQELKKIAQRVEDEIYTVATSQSEYSRKICWHMLTIETRLQNTMSDFTLSDFTQSNSTTVSVNPSIPFDSKANGGDWQEIVYQKIKIMMVLYLLDTMPVDSARSTLGDPTMESGDWRVQVKAESRQKIVNKILDTLKRHIPFSGHEGLQELRKIAVRFEERMYTDCTSQCDYLRKISLKMLTIETRL